MVVDIIFNHIGGSHPWVQDPPAKDWINKSPSRRGNHQKTIFYDNYASKYDSDVMKYSGFQVDINQANPHISRYLIQNTIWWIEYANLDGLRVDTYPYIEMIPGSEWVKAIMDEYPNLNIVGECWTRPTPAVAYWQSGVKNHNGFDSHLPSVMDFPLEEAIRLALESENQGWGGGLTRVYDVLTMDYMYADVNDILIMLGNHDMDRIADVVKDQDPRRVKLAYALLATMRGIPQVFYGDEYAMKSADRKLGHSTLRMPLPIGEQVTAEMQDMFNYQSRLFQWRKGEEVIHTGRTMHFMSRDKWLNITFTTKISQNLMRNTKYNFIGSSKMAGIVFAVLSVVMLVSLTFRGMQQSIDFTGGRNFVVQFEQKVEPEQVRELLKTKITDDNVQAIALGTDGKTIRISTNYMINDTAKSADRQIEVFLYEAFTEGGLVDAANVSLSTFRDIENRNGGSIISSQKVGPSIAADIRNGAIISVILALIAIFVYILVRFRNVAYSIGSIVALGVDVLLIMGCYSLLHGVLPMSLEADQVFIGAILTAIGYSINDKVVVFDRIREFTGLYPKRDKRELFNLSLNTTLARTINTSVSTLIVLLCIFILGGDSIRSFSFAMILGVVFGTLSSLFIAAPIALACLKKK